MATIGASSASNNAFGFSLQTSSGDVINLSMYDTRTTDISQETNGNTRTTTLSLSHAYGYNFQYQGDGIDANDQKEIDEAMKAIQPMMDKYLQSVKESATNQAQITNSAFDISSKLPTQPIPIHKIISMIRCLRHWITFSPKHNIKMKKHSMKHKNSLMLF